MADNRPQFSNSDKDLVAEQPGLGLSFIGLFLAFFVGLAIKAAVSPERVERHLRQATANIHKNVHFNFQRAYVSFSRGIWPDLSVVVKNVTIDSDQSCWMTPQAEINEIRLPLSFRHLFRGQILIHEILADEVNLSLRTPFSNCSAEAGSEGPHRPRRQTAQAPKEKTPSQASIGKFENVSRPNPIDTIQIATLNVHYLPIAFTSFDVKDFQILLKSESPRWIQVDGQLILDGDTLMGDYSSHADIHVDSIEGDKAQVQATVKGDLREGHYTLVAGLDRQTQTLSLKADALHLPLSRILPLLKKYRWVESEFNGRGAWFSGHMKMTGPLEKLRETPLTLDRMKLEGDLGEITCNQAEIQSLQPLQFKPVDFDIRGLNIKELLVFLNRPHPTPALGDLGIFNGSAHFINPDKMVVRGDYSGLEFIFANRGQRQSQVLSLVSGELNLSQSGWDIQVDRIKPVEGIFEGKVGMKADKDFKDLEVKAQITELGLSPSVQSLMTGGGSLGAMSGDLTTHLKSAQISSLKGQLKWDQILIEGVRIARPKLNLQSKAGAVEMKMSAQEIEFSDQSLPAQFLSPILDQFASKNYLLKSVSGILRTRNFSTFEWDQMQSQSPPLRTRGKWDENSQLSGEIQVLGKGHQIWNVKGSRGQPQLQAKDI